MQCPAGAPHACCLAERCLTGRFVCACLWGLLWAVPRRGTPVLRLGFGLWPVVALAVCSALPGEPLRLLFGGILLGRGYGAEDGQMI